MAQDSLRGGHTNVGPRNMPPPQPFPVVGPQLGPSSGQPSPAGSDMALLKWVSAPALASALSRSGLTVPPR